MRLDQQLSKFKKKRPLENTIFSNPDLKWKKIDTFLGEDVVLFEELDESNIDSDLLQQIEMKSSSEEQPKKKKKIQKTVELKQHDQPQQTKKDVKEKVSKEKQDFSNFVLPEAFSPWEDFEISGLLDNRILKAIVDQGYTAPTPIQKKSLIAALRHRKDVIGAAQTGSGKTLAFGLPVLQVLLQKLDFEKENKLQALILSPTRELAMQIANHLNKAAQYTNLKIASIVGGMSKHKQEKIITEKKPHVVIATPGRLWDLMNHFPTNIYLRDATDLQFLIVDEADRMIDYGHFQELQFILAALSGNHDSEIEITEDQMSNKRTKKKSKKSKEKKNNKTEMEEEEEEEDYDMNATITELNMDGSSVHQVIEEKKIDPVTNSVIQKRQTMVFSATLTLPNMLKSKHQSKTNKQVTSPLDKLMNAIQFQKKIEVIDLTTKVFVADTLKEEKVTCLAEDKEMYLYYILEEYAKSGKTLIFVNSIATIRRLVPILQILKIPAYSLHANMIQKQRLKNLDKFTEDLNSNSSSQKENNERKVLIATDVAARGLDVPDVNLVIHYQLPRTAEIYIHRSGRTARAQKHGKTILIVDPDDKLAYNKILTHLGRSLNGELEDIPDLNVDNSIFPAIRKRMMLARKIDSSLHALKKMSNENKWINEIAKEADLDDDDKLSDDEQAEIHQKRKQHKKQAEELQRQLDALLNISLHNQHRKK